MAIDAMAYIREGTNVMKVSTMRYTVGVYIVEWTKTQEEIQDIPFMTCGLDAGPQSLVVDDYFSQVITKTGDGWSGNQD